jgi:hypothetical protein
MIYEFEVIAHKWHHNRGDFIFARHLGSTNDLKIPEGSVFGDVPIYDYTQVGPLHDDQGNRRLDIFVFRPVSMEWLDKNHFTEGQHVKLIIE